MELAVKGFIPLKLFKTQEQANIIDAEQPKLREELRECIQQMKHNEAVYDLVSEPELIDAAIYERQALICRYEYLLRAVKGTK